MMNITFNEQSQQHKWNDVGEDHGVWENGRLYIPLAEANSWVVFPGNYVATAIPKKDGTLVAVERIVLGLPAKGVE